jgi:hypothetical protein
MILIGSDLGLDFFSAVSRDLETSTGTEKAEVE